MTRSAPATSFPPAARSRLLAAIGVSLLVHLSMPLVLRGGASRTAAPGEPGPLSVRVVTEPAPVVPPVLPPSPGEPQMERARPAIPERPQPQRTAAAPQAAEPTGDFPQAPDLTYYPARQLDVYPAFAVQPDLAYRGKAAAEGVTGRALLLVLIDEAGTVKDVSVVEAEPASYFEEEARRALAAARFTPAYRNGRAVRSRVLIEVNYGVP